MRRKLEIQQLEFKYQTKLKELKELRSNRQEEYVIRNTTIQNLRQVYFLRFSLIFPKENAELEMIIQICKEQCVYCEHHKNEILASSYPRQFKKLAIVMPFTIKHVALVKENLYKWIDLFPCNPYKVSTTSLVALNTILAIQQSNRFLLVLQ